MQCGMRNAECGVAPCSSGVRKFTRRGGHAETHARAEPSIRRAGQRGNRRGVALVMVVFVIAFLTALAVAMLEEATTDLAIYRNHTFGLKAMYAAHAGVGKAVEQFRIKWDNVNSISGSVAAPDGTTVSYSATIARSNAVNMTVTSTGTAGGYTRRIEARIVVSEAKLGIYYPARIVWWREAV